MEKKHNKMCVTYHLEPQGVQEHKTSYTQFYTYYENQSCCVCECEEWTEVCGGPIYNHNVWELCLVAVIWNNHNHVDWSFLFCALQLLPLPLHSPLCSSLYLYWRSWILWFQIWQNVKWDQEGLESQGHVLEDTMEGFSSTQFKIKINVCNFEIVCSL